MAAVTAGVIIAAAGLAMSMYGQYKSYKAQKKAAKAQKRERDLRFRRERREQIRRAQIAQAQIENTGAQVGGGVGNVAGGARSVQSQAGANIGFAGGVNAYQNMYARQMGKAQDYQMVAEVGNQIFGIGTMVAGGGQQSNPFGNIVKSGQTGQTMNMSSTAASFYGYQGQGYSGAFS